MAFRRLLLNTCNGLDPYFHKVRRLVSIETEGQPTVFRVRLMRYRGNSVKLSDGCVINKGDTLLKIHLHNIKLLQSLQSTTSQVKRTYKMYQMVDRALPSLAEYIQKHPLKDDIKGICGITMINQLVERLGFEVRPVKSKAFRLLKYTSQTPIQFLATGSFSGLFKKRDVSYLIMSKDRLFQYKPVTCVADLEAENEDKVRAANLL